MAWNYARIDCFKNEAELASLSHNKLNIAKEYLERVQVRLLAGRKVTVGLLKIGQEWKWVDGENFNGSLPIQLGVTKGRLVWSNAETDWILKEIEYDDVEEMSDLHFCVKVHGETISLSIVLLVSLLKFFCVSLQRTWLIAI